MTPSVSPSFAPLAPAAPGLMLDGLDERVNPGTYEAIVREASSVLSFETYARNLIVQVGNPVDPKFGITYKLGMIGSDGQQGGGMAGMMGMGGPPAPTPRARRFELGAYHFPSGDVRDGSVQAKINEIGSVMGIWDKAWSPRVRTTVAGRVGEGALASDLTAMATYRGDKFSVSARTAVDPSPSNAAGRAPLPLFGASYLHSISKHVALGGEVYFDAHKHRGAKLGITARGRPPAKHFGFSLSSVYNTPETQAVVQYGHGAAGGLIHLYWLQRVTENVKLASNLIVRPIDQRSQLAVGAQVSLPLTKSTVRCMVDSVGRVKSVWERRLLSTVRLRVSSELDFVGVTQKGHQFGLSLQVGYAPEIVRQRTPQLIAWGREYVGHSSRSS